MEVAGLAGGDLLGLCGEERFGGIARTEELSATPATEPTLTRTPPATFSTTGTCFSRAASVVFSASRFMGTLQQTSVPPPARINSTVFPQTLHW
jgi:hypothetical protein